MLYTLDVAPRKVSSSDSQSTLTDALVQLSFEVQRRLANVAADYDLSLAQLRLLGVLRDHQPGIQRLADHLGLEKSSVSGLVDRAEARGLVRRISNADDGRSVHVTLSRRGRSLAKQGEREVEEAMSDLVTHLTDADRDRLADLLTRAFSDPDRPDGLT